MNSLREMIESASIDDDYDRLALGVAQDVYEQLGDRSFDWLTECAQGADDEDAAAKYWHVLSSVGAFSDGFTPEFLDRACEIVLDVSAPIDARLSCANGALRWRVLYRPEQVYQGMQSLCDFILGDRGAVGRDRVASGNAIAAQSLLRKRALALATLRDGRLIVPDIVLAQATDVSRTTGMRMSALGLGPDDAQALRQLVSLALHWGVRSIWPGIDGSNVNLLTIRAKQTVRFDQIFVRWVTDGGRSRVTELGISE